MNNKVKGVERDLVLISLYSFKTNLILSSKDDKPSIIPYNSYSVPSENLIYISKSIFNSVLPNFKENTEITVCFFYHGRGIFFKTFPKLSTNGYILFIPEVLYKQQNKITETKPSVYGKLFYTGKEEKGRFINCISNEKYPLFEPFLWKYFSEEEVYNASKVLSEIAQVEICNKDSELENTFKIAHKILYLPERKIPEKNYFPFDATFTTTDNINENVVHFDKEVYIPLLDVRLGENKPHTICSIKNNSVLISPLDIDDTVWAFPICRFLTSTEKKIGAIESRANPLEILFISEGSIILAQDGGIFALQTGTEYPISLFVDLPIGKREVFLIVYVSKIYESKNYLNDKSLVQSPLGNKSVAICRFTSIKEEDRRFLFEKLYGTRYK